MRKPLLQVYLLSLFIICFATACGDNSQPLEVDDQVTKTEQMPPLSQEVPVIHVDNLEEISALPEEIPYYGGILHMDELGGIQEPANFKRHPFIPYGFYIFESMEEYELEDGTEWGMDNQRNLFSIFDKSQTSFEANSTNPLLTRYKEYMGSDIDEGGSYYDYFNFQDHGHDLVVRIHYFEEDKQTILPIFLDVLRSIHYLPNSNSFEPGVTFDFPAGTDNDEEEVIQLVKKNIEAMVNKDKAVFRSTLEHPDADYFDFLIDTQRKYRFTELEMIEPFDPSTGRKNIHIRFEFLEDGLVEQYRYIFTSLKGKDGSWKIASID